MEYRDQENQLEKIFEQIDRSIRSWFWSYAILFFLIFFSVISCITAIFMSIHYLIAISLGIIILSSLTFSCAHLYIQEEFNLLQEKSIEQLSLLFQQEQSDAAANFIKTAACIKKRASYILEKPSSFIQKICNYPITKLVERYGWIPYLFLSYAFYKTAVILYIQSIRNNPKEPTLHAELAHTYVSIAILMKEGASLAKTHAIQLPIISKNLYNNLQRKWETSSLRAIQELEILKSFQPGKLWVLDQLAISYKELGMEKEEMKIYEEILALDPDDTNALFRLGSLSFQKGDNGRGLTLYDTLLYIQPQMAEELIHSFGAYDIAIDIPKKTNAKGLD